MKNPQTHLAKMVLEDDTNKFSKEFIIFESIDLSELDFTTQTIHKAAKKLPKSVFVDF